MTKAAVILVVPANPRGVFVAHGASILDNEELDETHTGRIELDAIAASFLDAAGTKSFHVWQDRDDSFLTLIEDDAVFNPNPVAQLLDGMGEIEAAGADWPSWDTALADVAATYPRSLHGRIEPAIAKIILLHVVERIGLGQGTVEMLLATQSTSPPPPVLGRIKNGWADTHIRRCDDEASDAEIDGRLAPGTASEFLCRLLALATVHDPVAGHKLRSARSKGTRDDLGKALPGQNCAAKEARFWPVISLEAHPDEPSALLVRGWLFHLSDTSSDEDENAATTFTRSLDLISEGTLAAQDLLEPARLAEVIHAFAPRAGELGVAIKEPELVKSFLVGAPFGHLGAEAAAAARALWQVSGADPNIVQGAVVLRRSRPLDHGDAEAQGARPLFMGSPPEAPSQPRARGSKDAADGATTLARAVEAMVGSQEPGPLEEEVAEAPPPKTKSARSKRSRKAPAKRKPSQVELPAALEALRKRLEAKPAEAGRVTPMLRDELSRAAQSGAILGYGGLVAALAEAGFADVEETADGLVLGVGGVPDGITVTATDPDDVLHPRFQARRVVEALQPREAVDLAAEAAAEPVLGASGHYLRALLDALDDAGGRRGEGLVRRGAGLEELLVVRLLSWLVRVREDLGDEGAYADRVLANGSALGKATGLLRDVVAAIDPPHGGEEDTPEEEEAAGAEPDLPAQAERIWKSDLENGRAFLTPPEVPFSEKAART